MSPPKKGIRWKIDSHLSLRREPFEISHALEQDQLKNNHTLLKVTHVGLNHLDLWVYKGVPGHKFPLPLVPGTDMVGMTPEGKRVLVCPGVSCGKCEGCLSGFEPLCSTYGIMGETRDGGCSDYAFVPTQNLIALPDSLSSEAAVALPVPYMTAFTMLVQRAQLKKGERILIHSATSAVSIASLQIAKWIGAKTTLTVSHRDNLDFAKQLGADNVLVRPEREAHRYHVVVDHIGADTFTGSLKSLEKGGRLVTCGSTSGSAVEIDLKLIFFKNLSILGTTMGNKRDLEEIVGLASKGILNPVIDRTLPMAELPQALSLISERKTRGKIVLLN